MQARAEYSRQHELWRFVIYGNRAEVLHKSEYRYLDDIDASGDGKKWITKKVCTHCA